jgi:hypothetical protein
MKTKTNGQNGLSKEEALHRAEDCSAKELCFISLKPIPSGDEAKVDGVYINKKYLNK